MVSLVISGADDAETVAAAFDDDRAAKRYQTKLMTSLPDTHIRRVPVSTWLEDV